MKKIRYLLVLVILLLFPVIVSADEKEINVYLFEGDGCPHCAAEKKFWNSYLKEHDNVKLYEYEVWYDKKNQEILKKVQEKLDNKESGVPYTVIGDKVIVGYNDYNTKDQLEKYVKDALEDENYKDYVGEIVGVESSYNTSEMKKAVEETDMIETKKETEEDVDVPVFGKVNPKDVSLPLLSITLGFIDGFNPCAMWILLFLITMLFNMKDKKKMWILGMTFILTSGIVYLAFMLTWLNLATFISKLSMIRLLVATVAVVVGIWNLIKFTNSLNEKDTGCDVVDTKERKKIMDRIRNITTEKKFVLALISIAILAASVNIIELMCSIGIPLLFTQILAMNDLSNIQYAIYMFLYILFFLIDDIVVFIIAMITSKITVASTKYAKYSHLVGGIIMVIIGVLLIIKPELLMFNF